MNYKEKLREIINNNSEYYPSKDKEVFAKYFPELKESNDDRIVRCLLNYFHHVRYNGLDLKGTDVDEVIAWLEKQGQKPKKVSIWKHWKNGIAGNGEDRQVYLIRTGNTYNLSSVLSFECDYIELSELDNLMLENQGEKQLVNFDEAEKEKVDFVGDGFIKCHADFLDFKDGETYWLEYTGDDMYNVRSDNLLGRTYHITPGQLYTVFKKLTWLEKQGKKVKEAGYEWDADKKELKKIEPKFSVDDWIVTEDSFGKIVRHIDAISYNLIVQGYTVSDENGLIYKISFSNENKWHKWTIQDAEDGDVLATENFIFIFKNIDDGNGVHYYCQYEISKHEDDNQFDIALPQSLMGRVGNSISHYSPATKEQRDLLFQKMKETGYEWDSEKKELKKIV